MSASAAHADEAERQALAAAGAALYAAMERIVDANPFYANTPPIERGACIGRLAIQALADAVCAHVDGGRPQTYVLVSSMGRILGQIIYGQPGVDPAGALQLLQTEMMTGHRDVETLLKPVGRT
jgi:hypothetical protein